MIWCNFWRQRARWLVLISIVSLWARETNQPSFICMVEGSVWDPHLATGNNSFKISQLHKTFYAYAYFMFVLAFCEENAFGTLANTWRAYALLLLTTLWAPDSVFPLLWRSALRRIYGLPTPMVEECHQVWYTSSPFVYLLFPLTTCIKDFCPGHVLFS